jgi:hypothetical protein
MESPYSNNPDPVGVSLQEIADEIRRHRTAPSAKSRPWWVQTLLGGGVGAFFAYVLLQFMIGTQAEALKAVLANTISTKMMMDQAQKDMSKYAEVDREYKDLILIVQRQACRNSAQVASPTYRQDRDACDVIRAPR